MFFPFSSLNFNMFLAKKNLILIFWRVEREIERPDKLATELFGDLLQVHDMGWDMF